MKPYTYRTRDLYVREVENQPDATALRVCTLRTLTATAPADNRGNYIAPTAFAYTVTQDEYYKGTRAQYRNGKVATRESGVLDMGATYCVDPDYNNVLNNVINNALTKLNEQVQGNLNLAVSLAESGQTKKMLALTSRLTSALVSMKSSYRRAVLNRIHSWKRSRRIRKYLERWQRGIKASPLGKKYYRPKKIDQSLIGRLTELGANGWLEFAYGWQPLYYDIYGLAQASLGNTYNQLTRIKAKSRQQFVVPFSRTIPGYLPVPARGKSEVTVAVTFGLSLKLDFDAGSARFTSLNPLGVAYELLPYSFVVDWFFDLGSYMQNMEAAARHGLSFRSGYRSVLVRWKSTCYGYLRYAHKAGRNAIVTTESGHGSRTRTQFSRAVLTAYPVPRYPSCKIDLGSRQLLSAASLLRQLIRR